MTTPLARSQPGVWRDQSGVCSDVGRRLARATQFLASDYLFFLYCCAPHFSEAWKIPSPATRWNVIPQCYCLPPASSIAVNKVSIFGRDPVLMRIQTF